MTNRRETQLLFEVARQQMGLGNAPGAIEALRRGLAEDPDHAASHALLALCLLRTRRLAAAEIEARLALTLAPEGPLPMFVMGAVWTAQRRFKQAGEIYQRLIERDPTDAQAWFAVARLYVLTDRRAQAREALQRALELDPEDADTLAELGDLELAEGRDAEAARRAHEALQRMPEHQGALVLMGRLALHQGDMRSAYEHAVWALRINPADPAALYLLAGIKARQSWWLGLWWRFNAFLQRRGESARILILLAMYLLYRLGRQAAIDLHSPQGAQLIVFAWLAICAYTWAGAGWFRRSLERELQSVTLRKDF